LASRQGAPVLLGGPLGRPTSSAWSCQLGLVLLDLILALLVPADKPVRLVVDDTLFRRSGRRVFGAAWHHDPLGVGRNAIAWGNNWVVVGVLVDLPMVPHRPVCLPILARLWWPGHTPGRLELALEVVKLICEHLGPCRVDLVLDGAYACKALQALPRQVTVTTRLRADAALYQLPGHAGPTSAADHRPKAPAYPGLTRLAGMTSTPFALMVATLYGTPRTLAVAHFTCLWPSVFGPRPVHVTLLRDPAHPTASTLRWSPPTLRPPRTCWYAATPLAGASRSASATPARTPASARPATAPSVPCSAPSRSGWSASASPWCGTPPAATTLATWPPAAPARPGTTPSTPLAWPTCSPNSAGCSSPRNIGQVSPQPRPCQKSSRSREPGPPPKAELRNSRQGRADR
jgi:hypothetical protein